MVLGDSRHINTYVLADWNHGTATGDCLIVGTVSLSTSKGRLDLERVAALQDVVVCFSGKSSG